MSRAFTREIDDAPPPPVPERPVSSARNLVTPNGALKIEAMILAMNQKVETCHDAVAVASLKRDLRYWQARKASMERVEPVDQPASVRFGAHVTIKRGGEVKNLIIVGEDEADPSAGTIAWTSPLARALDGAGAGDVVEFEAAGREEEIVILSVMGA